MAQDVSYSYEDYLKDITTLNADSERLKMMTGFAGTSHFASKEGYLRKLQELGLSPATGSGSLASLQASIGGGSGGNNLFSEAADLIKKALPDYSKAAAFADSKAVIEDAIAKSMEANKPAIQRSIEGAGTSASSMAGLLSQKLATETARSAAVAGADQAKSYGGILSNLLASLAGMGSNGDPTAKLAAQLRAAEIQASAVGNASRGSSSSSSGAGNSRQTAAAAAPTQAASAGWSNGFTPSSPSYGGSFATAPGATYVPGMDPGQGFITTNRTDGSSVTSTFGGFQMPKTSRSLLEDDYPTDANGELQFDN